MDLDLDQDRDQRISRKGRSRGHASTLEGFEMDGLYTAGHVSGGRGVHCKARLERAVAAARFWHGYVCTASPLFRDRRQSVSICALGGHADVNGREWEEDPWTASGVVEQRVYGGRERL